jgi:hypothetical protein
MYLYMYQVTTWFEIVQGFVEHVNAAGLVCATATCFSAVRAIEYSNSLPEQVNSTFVFQHFPLIYHPYCVLFKVNGPDLAPIWAIFGFALACVPLSVGGFFASWTEHRVGLRVYGSFAGEFISYLCL